MAIIFHIDERIIRKSLNTEQVQGSCTNQNFHSSIHNQSHCKKWMIAEKITSIFQNPFNYHDHPEQYNDNCFYLFTSNIHNNWIRCNIHSENIFIYSFKETYLFIVNFMFRNKLKNFWSLKTVQDVLVMIPGHDFQRIISIISNKNHTISHFPILF